MLKTLFIGIDVAADSATVCLLSQEGERIGKILHIENTPAGACRLEAHLVAVATEGGYQKLKIGLEATSFYDWHLADFLSTSEALARRAKTEVFRLNALRVSRFRKSMGHPDKTDPIDAAVIADFLRVGRGLPAPHLSADPYLPMKRLTRYRFHLVGTLIRESGHLLTHLFLQSSGLSQQNPLGHPTRATGCALLSEFASSEEIAQKPIEALVDFLVLHGKNRFPDPQGMAKRIQQAARESFRLRPELARSEHFILANLIQNIRGLKGSLKEINKAVANEARAFPHTLTSLPGVGPVLSAGILSEIGDIRRFKDDNAIAKMAGFVWGRHQSGDFEAEDRRMLRSANKYLRYYLVEAANALRMHDASYRAFYEAKFKEVPKHQHKRALVLTARKLVRLVYALLKHSQLYRPATAQPVGRSHN